MIDQAECLGLALGSGAARGWAHIGAIRALEEVGLRPRIVCGASIGAVVGAIYAADDLDAFETWVRALDWRRVVSYIDVTLRGGFIRARRVFDAIAQQFPDRPIESLPRRYAAVATDLTTGREVWLREGSVIEAMRASTAIPGLVTPAWHEGRWLVDGGLVNPVPVSLCRALGADRVIGVDLNTTLLDRRFRAVPAEDRVVVEETPPPPPPPGTLLERLQARAAEILQRGGDAGAGDRSDTPSIYEVMANSLNIMQIRIQRSRMAGDPPDLLVAPRLGDFGLFDFDRAAEAIEEGRAAVARALAPNAARS